MLKQDKGLLITLEGIDGCGKTTLAQALFNYLKSIDRSVVLTREPGATQLGSVIRTLVNTRTYPIDSTAELLLFAADRAQHFKEIVIPALQENKIVISDRMADSSLAYQGFGRGLDKEFIKLLNNHIMGDHTPDVTFYIRLDYDTAYKRMQTRKEQLTAFDQEKYSFFSRVINGFDTIFTNKSHVITIDGSQSQDCVASEAINYIRNILR